jgi:Protein of unknown function (DUF4238)
VRPPSPASTSAKPKSVGYRTNFWGRDARVRRVAEEQINRIESDAAVALRRLAREQSLVRGSRDWRAIAFLIAVHLVRNPYGRERLRRIQLEVLERNLPTYTARMSPSQGDSFLRQITTDAYWVQLVLEDMPKLASVVASMHWTVLAFNDELLATSDQPVTVMPLLAADRSAPVKPLPPGALIDCEEIRIATNPQQALVLTWLDEPDDTPPHRGTDELAAQLNRAVISQADQEWFHHPARRPTTLTPPLFASSGCAPLGRLLHAHYDARYAEQSRRRADTTANLEQMIEEGISDEMRVVSVARTAA